MALLVRFMTLTGAFTFAGVEKTYPDTKSALAAVTEYASAGGYTNVKIVRDVDSIRFTARTPGGRSGRNIAFGDFMDTESLSAHLIESNSAPGPTSAGPASASDAGADSGAGAANTGAVTLKLGSGFDNSMSAGDACPGCGDIEPLRRPGVLCWDCERGAKS